nr:hypothetical protein [Tanacetum cinerariifolium]
MCWWEFCDGSVWDSSDGEGVGLEDGDEVEVGSRDGDGDKFDSGMVSMGVFGVEVEIDMLGIVSEKEVVVH